MLWRSTASHACRSFAAAVASAIGILAQTSSSLSSTFIAIAGRPTRRLGSHPAGPDPNVAPFARRAQVASLAALTALTDLVLAGNPAARQTDYRRRVWGFLRPLESLDHA